MKLIEAVKAYETIETMKNMELDFASAHSLALARKELETHVSFFIDEERKLIEKHGEKNAEGRVEISENGKFSIPTSEIHAYAKQHAELDNVEIAFTKRQLRLRSATPAMVEALLPCFDFKTANDEVIA